jgi:hypothetical protein
MVDSKEFAVGIFDALARRRRQNLERITKEELYDFWLQISDQSFDARLQIFFDMYFNFTRPISLLSFPGSQVTSEIDPSQLPMRAHLHYATLCPPPDS